MPEEKKRWRMYKKADTAIIVDGDTTRIIPKFTSESKSITNEYGLWTIDCDYEGTTGASYQSLWQAYDGRSSTAFTVKTNDKYGSDVFMGTVIQFPKGVIISPESVTFRISTNCSKVMVKAIPVNPDTGEWLYRPAKQLISMQDRTSQDITVKFDGQYYDRVYVYGNILTYSTTLSIYDVKLTGKCKIKVLPNI